MCRTSMRTSTSATNSWKRSVELRPSGFVYGRRMSIKVGDIAPSFTLPGTGGRTYSLSDFAGKPLVIAFSSGVGYASFGTVHARVRRMVENGVLKRSVCNKNQRYRPIEEGPKLKKFLAELSEQK